LLLGRLVAGAGAIRVRQRGGDRAGEMRIPRVLRHRRVTVGERFGTAAHPAGLLAGRHGLAIQHTTSLRDDGAGHRLTLHAMIAADATKPALLGLLHGRMLVQRGGRMPAAVCDAAVPALQRHDHRLVRCVRVEAVVREGVAA
jgi:hypothetical protein